ncbi:DEAD/DEAH box helicase [Fluviispira sanaruensis]|uniref:DEAD/DEAH box helicase n=1 Tax=Fluviispira sanaruensis TaxID=2493639 RepID=UPI00102E529D|nr:DEAD/DEAH box helicase [Fluviispira sanaruensis]
MGFRGNNRNTYRPKPPKGPVRLTFGIIEDKTNETKPVAIAQPQFEKQEIIGTLYLKKIKIDNVKPLPAKHISRIIENISKIYEEGRYLNTNTVIDSENNIFKVTFNYNQNTIDRIKGLDRNERQWEPEERLWKVYIASFDDLFDILGKGFKLTDNAFQEIKEFVKSKYYAHIAPSKLGKLILRESWFEEFDLSTEVNALQGSEAMALHGSVISNYSKPQLELLEKIKQQISLFSFKRKPYSHQLVGIEFLLQNPACALLDEMGCGKSFQIASSVAMLLQSKTIDRCLIVAPKSLIRTWQEEMSLATSIPYTVIEGSPAQRAKLLKSPSQIFIVHYEGIRLEKEALSEWIKEGEGMLVFDESQRIKNLNAQTTISAKYIRNSAKRCVIATGTPIANRPLDLFAQYFVMDNGNTFGTSFPAFKNTFCYIDILEINQGRRKVKIEKFMGVRNGEELRKRILATSLRRLKNEVLDLPPIIFKDYAIELKAEQKTIYAKMRDSVRSEIENMSPEEYASQANNIVVRLLRLSQIASNPKLIDPKYDGTNAKLSELEDLLTDIFSDETKKVILWSHFVGNVNYLAETYQETWGAVAHTGEMNIEERAHSIEQFQNNPECRLFIATPQSAKEGLTLLPRDGKMKADTMIYMDLNFDGGSYVQSQARFHRIGQNAEKCLVIHLLGVDTVDEYIKKSLIDKIQTASQILDNASQEQLNQIKGESFKLSKEEILNIL